MVRKIVVRLDWNPQRKIILESVPDIVKACEVVELLAKSGVFDRDLVGIVGIYGFENDSVVDDEEIKVYIKDNRNREKSNIYFPVFFWIVQAASLVVGVYFNTIKVFFASFLIGNLFISFCVVWH